MTENRTESADFDRDLPEHHPYKMKRTRPQYSAKPYCIYYYHVTDITTEPWKLKHYYLSDNGDIRRGDLERLARSLGRNAMKIHGTPPPMRNEDFEDVYWTRISYIMFLFDIPGVSLQHNRALEIEYLDGSGRRRPNHTFFDADDFTVDLSDNGDGAHERPVVYCVNHLQKDTRGGRLEEDETQYFIFNFNFEGNVVGVRPIIRLPNSGGTNQGGGVPPPEI